MGGGGILPTMYERGNVRDMSVFCCSLFHLRLKLQAIIFNMVKEWDNMMRSANLEKMGTHFERLQIKTFCNLPPHAQANKCQYDDNNCSD